MIKFIVFIGFLLSTCFAQIDISRVSIDIGYVKNYHDVGNRQYSFYPEIKIGGKLFVKNFEWEIYTGYWDDGITTQLDGVIDYVTNSYSNFITGGKVYYIPGTSKFNFIINGGISYRYTKQKYISGSQTGLDSDEEFNILSLDLGAGLRYNLNLNFRLRVEFNSYIILNYDQNYYRWLNNHSFKFGVDYFF